MKRALLLAVVLLVIAILAGCADDKAVQAEDLGTSPASPECLGAVPGDACGGGIVFTTSFVSGGVPVTLVAADTDEPGTLTWTALGTPLALLTNAGSLDNGKLNTDTFSSLHPASWACQQSTRNGYTDWYLPAKDELGALVSGAAVSLPGAFYWSSTQLDATFAHFYDLTLLSFDIDNKQVSYSVRCIRRPF